MECRCYHGGEGRTKMKQLCFHAGDIVTLCIGGLLLGGVIALRYFGL